MKNNAAKAALVDADYTKTKTANDNLIKSSNESLVNSIQNSERLSGFLLSKITLEIDGELVPIYNILTNTPLEGELKKQKQ